MLKFGNTPFDKYLTVTRPIIWLFVALFICLTAAFIISVCWIFYKMGIPASPLKVIFLIGFITFIFFMMGKSADDTYRTIALSDQATQRRKSETEKRKMIDKKETPWSVDWSDEK